MTDVVRNSSKTEDTTEKQVTDVRASSTRVSLSLHFPAMEFLNVPMGRTRNGCVPTVTSFSTESSSSAYSYPSPSLFLNTGE